ncbi:MAG: M20/M25/M40 family metallo-hydrolase [Chloroflexi bacterium]|nr:M20/M25/M40 family metallo-hydrolase [Chloroflexota bacterium]
MIDRDRLVRTFTDLVRIDSPSGEEVAIADALTARLTNLGFTVSRDAYGNVIASEPGDSPLLLSAHMDTVEPGRGVNPLIDGDVIHTDGSTVLGGDCKAGLSVILEALESLQSDGAARRPLEIALPPEEGIGLVGAKNLDFSMLRAKQAIVFDGEGPAYHVTTGSPTYIAFDIDITGRAAHAGVEPEKGISAIQIAAEMIVQMRLGRLDENTTFNVGNIEGGSVRNAVPEHASLKGETRSHDPEALERVRSYLLNIVQDTRGRWTEATIECELYEQFVGYRLDEGTGLLTRVKETLGVLGMAPELAISGGGTDGNVFVLNGIEAVVVGAAMHDAHTVRESVRISELEQGAQFCRALLEI